MNNNHAVGFGIGLLAGVAIGGVIALLYAPKTGKETRQLIKDKTTDVVNAVKGAASEANRRGQEAFHALKDERS